MGCVHCLILGVLLNSHALSLNTSIEKVCEIDMTAAYLEKFRKYFLEC